MPLNSESITHDPAAITDRMEAELRAICDEAPRVWATCLEQTTSIDMAHNPWVLTGCGDSYYAALSMRFILERLTQQPVVAWSAMEVTAYPSRLLHSSALVGVSVSGKVGRTIEAVQAHRAAGHMTAAVTAFGDSDLGQAADHVIATGTRGTPGPVPGTANYMGSLLGLLALGVATAPRENRADLESTIGTLLRTLPDLLVASTRLGEVVAQDLTEPFFVVGSGPDSGTAHYTVAKFLEAAATVGVAQDLEEWAHEQYFATDEGTAVVVIANDTPSQRRAADVVKMARTVGAKVISVGNFASSDADFTFELPAAAPGLSPLVSWVPGAAMALAYSRHYRRYPFGIDRAGRMRTVDTNIYVPAPTRA